jgi:hypothetical protein
MQSKPSKTRRPFVTFAVSRFLIRDQIVSELRDADFPLRANHPDIQAISLDSRLRGNDM